MPADNIFDGPVTNQVSILCIFIELFSRAQSKGGEGTGAGGWGGGGGGGA